MKLKIKNNYILAQCVLALAVIGFMIVKKTGRCPELKIRNITTPNNNAGNRE